MTPTPPEPTPETRATELPSGIEAAVMRGLGMKGPESDMRPFYLGRILKELQPFFAISAHPSPASAEAAAREIVSSQAVVSAISDGRINASEESIAAIILRHCSAPLAPALQGGEAKRSEELAYLKDYVIPEKDRYGKYWHDLAQERIVRLSEMTTERDNWRDTAKRLESSAPPQPLREVIERVLVNAGIHPATPKQDNDLTDRLLTALTPLLAHDKVTGETSDGYHTFNELYEHRCTLFLALIRSNPALSWISTKHADNSTFGDWFVAGMKLPTGDATYHLPAHMWALACATGAKVMERAPEWDGHKSADVVMRLQEWIALHDAAHNTPPSSSVLCGTLTRAGTFPVRDEEVTGYLVTCTREEMELVKHLPMMRRVVIVEEAHDKRSDGERSDNTKGGT